MPHRKKKVQKGRLNLPVPKQLHDATHRMARRANQHANEFVEAILRRYMEERGIDLNGSLEEVNARLDAMGFPPIPDDQGKQQRAKIKRRRGGLDGHPVCN